MQQTGNQIQTENKIASVLFSLKGWLRYNNMRTLDFDKLKSVI